MAVLKFTVERSGDLTAVVAQGRYRIIDFGREGWNASFTPVGGPEVALAPFKGGPYHANSKHAAARCQLHFHALSGAAAAGAAPAAGPAGVAGRSTPTGSG